MIPGPRTAADDDTDDDLTARAAAIRHLVDAAVAGDSQAFGLVWTEYQLTVFRFVYYRVATHALAEDLTSETCLRALRRIATFSWQGPDFGAWLVTIARNLIADHFKSSRVRREVAVADMYGTYDALDVLRAPGPDDTVLAQISHDAVHNAVGRLNDQQRECITLRYLKGLTIAETAAAMGKNAGAIKTLQWRAERTLARDSRLTPEMIA